MAEQQQKLIYLKQRWRHDDGREFRAGWVVVDEATAAEARAASATDETGEIAPPADYAAMYEAQIEAEGLKASRAAARKAARQARAAAQEG